MKEGWIQEQVTHDDLMSQNSEYSQLIQTYHEQQQKQGELITHGTCLGSIYNTDSAEINMFFYSLFIVCRNVNTAMNTAMICMIFGANCLFLAKWVR